MTHRIREIEGEEEVPKIVDFGLAIVRDRDGEDVDRLTTRGIVLGTPNYLAPETAIGKPIDRRRRARGALHVERLDVRRGFEGSPSWPSSSAIQEFVSGQQRSVRVTSPVGR